MKKKVIAIVCAVAVLAAAGGGVTWHFLGNSTKEDDNVVYVNTVKALTNLGTGNGMENRYAGVVESENTWKVEKNSEKKVKEVYVEVGQEVQVGTPPVSYTHLSGFPDRPFPCVKACNETQPVQRQISGNLV